MGRFQNKIVAGSGIALLHLLLQAVEALLQLLGQPLPGGPLLKLENLGAANAGIAVAVHMDTYDKLRPRLLNDIHPSGHVLLLAGLAGVRLIDHRFIIAGQHHLRALLLQGIPQREGNLQIKFRLRCTAGANAAAVIPAMPWVRAIVIPSRGPVGPALAWGLAVGAGVLPCAQPAASISVTQSTRGRNLSDEFIFFISGSILSRAAGRGYGAKGSDGVAFKDSGAKAPFISR